MLVSKDYLINMGKQTFYITRHGETFVTKKRRHVIYYGRWIYGAHILDEGKPAIERMGKFLNDIPTDVNYTSQFVRCRETAAIISNVTGKVFTADKRLNEIVFETPFNFRNRVKSFMQEVEAKDYENILVCTHGAVINEIAKFLVKEKTGYPDPGILIKISDGEIETFNFN